MSLAFPDLEFLVIALIVVATPGTGMIYTVAAGLTRGARASLVAAFGCTLGIVPHMLAAITGLAALLHASALLFDAVKYAGVAYLIWMAWQTWNDRGSLSLTGQGPHKSSALQVTVEAVVINLLNPKLSIFFFAFLPQFVDPAAPGALCAMLAMSGVFMAITLVVFALYGLFAAAVRDHVIGRPKVLLWMRRSFAAAFVALGAKLAVTER
ncbi:LysE family translocator [uncultured Ferrovibrio sp.]|jgi:threonine/homoserine/homoserine lactone efflux protein|uniref:LysE family translocator n=1 Tax=uncultured Ferrovibrio sp. TaxID=1576913 RepID=UPI00261C1524|nr:LysE family translocator [uncultured Ferrovibrio sp.]